MRISAIVSFGLLGYLILVVAHQMLVPPPAQRLIIVQDIPLPSGLAYNAQQATSLAPGVELQFDGFDFQAYDAATHRLFIAHTVRLSLVNFGSLPLFGGEHAPVTQPGNIPTYGHDVGHDDYDLGHDYVTSQVLPNADDPNAYILPPPHTAEFIAINAVTMKVDDRIVLPSYCSTPHGMTIDKEQHVAFVASTDFNPQAGFFENLLRVDLRTMSVIQTDPTTMRLANGPDLVRIDHPLHLLFVAGSGGVTIFDEKAGEFHRLGVAYVGKETHTIAINEHTQEVYFPIFAGGIPVLRITRYNPNGA